MKIIHRLDCRYWRSAVALIGGVFMLMALTAHARGNELFLFFPDGSLSQGDQISSAGDVESARLIFDTETGDFMVTWTAYIINPFDVNGSGLRFNLNAGNTRLASFVSLFGVFTDPMTTEELEYSGTQIALQNWRMGDTVVTFGSTPPFAFNFNSGLVDLNDNSISNRDLLLASGILCPTNTDIDDLFGNFIEDILEMSLSQGLENRLITKLEAALHAVTDNNPNNDHVANKKIQDFTKQVEGQRGKELTDEEADYLNATAYAVLLCGFSALP